MTTFAKLKSIARWTKYAARPSRLGRSLLYHCYYYKAGKLGFPGLHIGSGGLRIPTFVNMDADAAIDCDFIGGSETLKFSDSSIKVIFASHLFEHIPRARTDYVLREWRRVLSSDGRLYLCVPDLEALAHCYIDAIQDHSPTKGTESLDLITRVIYGGQSDRFDFHFNGYSMLTLKAQLEAAGFRNVRRFDRGTLAFAPFTDCGSAMIGDTLVSLNLEAEK